MRHRSERVKRERHRACDLPRGLADQFSLEPSLHRRDERGAFDQNAFGCPIERPPSEVSIQDLQIA